MWDPIVSEVLWGPQNVIPPCGLQSRAAQIRRTDCRGRTDPNYRERTRSHFSTLAVGRHSLSLFQEKCEFADDEDDGGDSGTNLPISLSLDVDDSDDEPSLGRKPGSRPSSKHRILSSDDEEDDGVKGEDGTSVTRGETVDKMSSSDPVVVQQERKHHADSEIQSGI